jgi:phosphoribosyl-AMP cyclohydrolase
MAPHRRLSEGVFFYTQTAIRKTGSEKAVSEKIMNWLDEVHWDADGLVPAIAQDFRTGRVLMMAWMNREALTLSAAEGRAIYWSRSRQRLWRKGEESGHVQTLHELRLDCDGDVIILQVEQIGGIACHTGRESCFYRRYNHAGEKNAGWETVDPILKDPQTIYADPHSEQEPHHE